MENPIHAWEYNQYSHNLLLWWKACEQSRKHYHKVQTYYQVWRDLYGSRQAFEWLADFTYRYMRQSNTNWFVRLCDWLGGIVYTVLGIT